MPKIQPTSNFIKHTSKNPLQRLLINNFYKNLVELAKPLNPNNVLDAGCGEGFSMNTLYINKVGKKIQGVDDSMDALTLGKKIFPYLSFKKGNIYNLPYKDNSFDLVICTEVLEHFKDPHKVLFEILRIARKNIIVSVPNEPFFTIQRFLRGKNIFRLGSHPQHIQHWSSKSFKEYIKDNGIKIKKVKLPFPWIMIVIEK